MHSHVFISLLLYLEAEHSVFYAQLVESSLEHRVLCLALYEQFGAS